MISSLRGGIALVRFFCLCAALVAMAGLQGCYSAPEEIALPPAVVTPAVRQRSIPRASKPHGEVASWYGPGFNGHITSTGERYNENALTAASKTLPLGSRVMVTNPENGRSVEVRINDRGPHVRGRSMDLSKRAAQKLGISRKGVARVQVTPLVPKSSRPPPAAPVAPTVITPTAVAGSHI